VSGTAMELIDFFDRSTPRAAAQAAYASRAPDASSLPALADLIRYWVPVLIRQQLDGVPQRWQQFCLNDDYTRGYLFGVVCELSTLMRLPLIERTRLGIDEAVFDDLYAQRSSMMLAQTIREMAAGSPRASAGGRQGQSDVREWILASLPAMGLAHEFSLHDESLLRFSDDASRHPL
jgi:hypothetical protein